MYIVFIVIERQVGKYRMVKSESVNRIRPVNKMTKRKRQIDKPRITTQKRLTNTNPQKRKVNMGAQ